MGLINIVIYTSIYLGLIATTFYILSYVAAKKDKVILFSDKELPRVSVIIPAYNEEKTIETTFNSILASDYPKEKLEIIFVNDGSKDNTLEVANRFKKRGIKIFSKKNGGKGSALNLGIKKSTGEIIFSMDADTIVDPKSLKNMTRYFKNEEIMCVSPAIVTQKPKSILQRVQYTEYLLGLFLRKTFSTLNAVHITPGAFSAYRKSFFEKYGGYDEGNITEDLELSLRVQYYGYKIENSAESLVYTTPPGKFSHLLKQRRRWYAGLMKNLWHYKKIISRKYGDLGMFVLPIAMVSIFFAVFVTIYFVFKTLFEIKDELILLSNINYDFNSLFEINSYVIERLFFLWITNPIIIFIAFFIVVTGFYLSYASKKLGKTYGLITNLFFFYLLFAVLFGFWWIVSVIYVFFNRKISWK